MKVGHRKKTLLTEINMVPFIDIVLVLLIIFMIVSPFLSQSEMPIRLPRALSGMAVQSDEPLKVRVTKDGDYYLGARRILRNDVEAELKSALAGAPGKAVMIEADRDVGFKSVVVALDAAERVGAAKVGVAVENPSSEEGQPAPVP
jgi:biopolymer transport protein ExbD